MKLKFSFTLLALLAYSAPSIAFDSDTDISFSDLCNRGTDGFPSDPDVVNCWGFEDESDVYYSYVYTGGDRCTDTDSFLRDHVNGYNNPEPLLNATVNAATCLYPKRVSNVATSGNFSMLVQQVEEGGGNGGGTFRPYFKVQTDSDGNYRIAAFGEGSDIWIHFRYRQNEELFRYHSKRFMVTHRESYFEAVINAYGLPTLDSNGNPTVGPKQMNDPYWGHGDFAYNSAYFNKSTYQDFGYYYDEPLRADFWHTFVLHIKIASAENVEDAEFELFRDGVKIFSNLAANMAPYWPNLGAPYIDDFLYLATRGAPGNIYDLNAYIRLDFLLFENGKGRDDQPHTDDYGTRGTGSMYIDDVVVARKRLPRILPDPSGPRPLPPAALAIQ